MAGETSLSLLYSFFWVNPRRLNFMCRRLFHLCMEQTECFEMMARKIQMSGIHPQERKQHSEHGRSLKSVCFLYIVLFNRMVKYFEEQLSFVYFFIHSCFPSWLASLLPSFLPFFCLPALSCLSCFPV